MVEYPIIFTGGMVRVILSGQKTQTRRVVVPQPRVFDNTGYPDYANLKDTKKKWLIGDTLWIRENWQAGVEWNNEKPRNIDPLCGGSDINYIAEGKKVDGGWGKVRPSIHMPRWAARIFLEITNIRVERVQDINLADIKAEGLLIDRKFQETKDAWITLWDSINAERGYGWDKNSWVWVVEFKKS